MSVPKVKNYTPKKKKKTHTHLQNAAENLWDEAWHQLSALLSPGGSSAWKTGTRGDRG